MALLFVVITTISQSNSFTNLHPDSVFRQNPRISAMSFVPGEIIVRFQDDIKISLTKSNNETRTGIDSFDQLVSKWKVTEIEPLFKGMEPLKIKEVLKSFNGKLIERPTLHNIYLLKTEVEPYQFYEAINDFQENKNLIYAEPNFIVSITDAEPISPPLKEDELLDWMEQQDLKNDKQITTVTPNDPLFSQQWGIPATQIDQVWSTTTGTADQIIAILDTGVDWNHPDLTDNIWNNLDESANGYDSDGNGFVDDVRGWDFVNNDNNPTDDNSHGTHVAGIAAAKGNNGIGIAGVNWAAKIMPVKVFQSSGQGNMATIVQGINYAAQNGATVINMSFGTYARSLALEDALADAYATAVLVAAAGNDGLCIGPGRCPDFQFGAPSYPGALPYVLGIEARPLPPAGFTNYDQDGPVFSAYDDLFNYELSAPGTQIVSTIPNGGYRVYNGTSMASPLVAGAVALYRTIKAGESQELMWGNLIQTVSDYLKLKDAIDVSPTPRLDIISNTINDTAEGDGDGNPDNGEVIQMWFNVKNSWGFAENVQIHLQLAEFEDPTVASITNPFINIGSISEYSTRSNESNPFRVELNNDLVHGRIIGFEVAIWEQSKQDTTTQLIYIVVINAVKVQGLITDTVTWTSDKTYYLVNNLRVSEQGKLIIMPGTIIIFNDGKFIEVRGVLEAIGTSENMITFRGTHSQAHIQGGFLFNAYYVTQQIAYSIFEGMNGVIEQSSGEINLQNSKIIDCSGVFNLRANKFLKKNVIINNYNLNTLYYLGGRIENCLYQNNTNFFSELNIHEGLDLFANSFISNSYYNELYSLSLDGYSSYGYLTSNYWGTTDSIKIQRSIHDFFYHPGRPIAIFSPYLVVPSENTHGHVWKVLVNGADAQDEFVEPVGVGQQRFDVYFNRPMDPAYPPQISFGVRAPYTQQTVVENGSWSEDHKVYTAYKTIQLYTGDGINTIRVSGAKDLEGFEIPIEDSRFEFLINAAGSASTDFTAAPGIGKVDLEWTYPEDLPTLLGFNIYRFNHLTDTTFSDTTLVNNMLVSDTLFTDFNVLPHQRYYYMYKIVRTDFTESDYSKVVNATVLTASPGDANGDLTVNVLDITTIIAHMLNQNPTPFISEAADINGDGTINVLDIIGVVNVLMGNTKMTHISQPGHIYLKQDRIDFKSDGSISGLQIQLISPKINELVLNKLPEGFEFAHIIKGDTLTGILFSMTNKTLPQERITIFSIDHHPGTLEIGEVFGGNYAGKHVAIYKNEDPNLIDFRYKALLHPNPTNETINLGLTTPEDATLSIKVYDLMGKRMFQLQKILTKGISNLSFTKQELGLNSGVYIIKIDMKPISPLEAPWVKDIKVVIF